MKHVNTRKFKAVGGAFSKAYGFVALRTSILLSFFVVGFLFAACEANELILPTTKNLGNAFDKYGIVQIGCVVFKTEWEGETHINF